MRGSVTTACPSAASVGADHRQDDGFLEAQLTEDPNRPKRAEQDGQRQADPEQADRHRDLESQVPEIDSRRVAEQHQCQRRLGKRPQRRARALDVDPAEHLGPDQQPDRHEHHRRCHRRAGQPPRDGGDGEQRDRHDCQGPRHRVRGRASSGSRRSERDRPRLERAAVHRDRLEERFVVYGEPPQVLLVLVHSHRRR